MSVRAFTEGVVHLEKTTEWLSSLGISTSSTRFEELVSLLQTNSERFGVVDHISFNLNSKLKQIFKDNYSLGVGIRRNKPSTGLINCLDNIAKYRHQYSWVAKVAIAQGYVRGDFNHSEIDNSFRIISDLLV